MRRVAILLVLLTACGGGSAQKTTEDTAPVSYGSGVDVPGDAGAAPPTSTSAPAGHRVEGGEGSTVAPVTATAGAPASSTTVRVANRTVIDDPSGFRLTLVVADKVTFAPSEDMVFELTFTNTTDRTLYIHADQREFFVLASADGTRVWSNDNAQCVSTPPPPIGIGVPVEPGDSNRFVRTYPGERASERRDRCRVGAGRYGVHGFLEWCPAATPQRRSCPAAEAARIDAAPLEVTITG